MPDKTTVERARKAKRQGKVKKSTRKSATYAYEAGQRRSAAARKAAPTRGAAGRSAAAKKAARTRARRKG